MLSTSEICSSSDAAPLVSVVMPVYNSAEYLGESLGSLLNQSYSNLEIICVNDGSRDNSLEILQGYRAKDPRIVVIDKENSGAGSTRNEGMDRVSGEYMCFVDSDDFLEKDAIKRLVHAAQENEADVVIFDIDQYDNVTGGFSPNDWAVSREHIPVRQVFYAADIDNFYKHLVGFTVNKLYRSSFLLGLGVRFPAIGAHEDMPFTYIALSAARRAYYLDEVLYHYRRSREGSLSDATSKRYTYMFDALECLHGGLQERGLWDDYERIFVNYALHMCAWKNDDLGKFRRLEFRDACRTIWFDRMGISNKDADYFLDEEDRTFMEGTVNMPFLRKLAAKCYRCKMALMKERA